MAYVIRRVLQGLATLLALLVLVFVLTRLTGDPARLMLPIEATPDEVAAFRHEHGFDLPMVAQLGLYLANLARGDLGQSLFWKAPVLEVVLGRLPATLQLGGAAMALVVLVGIPLGLLSAVHRGRWIDYACQLVALLGQSVPVFVTGDRKSVV